MAQLEAEAIKKARLAKTTINEKIYAVPVLTQEKAIKANKEAISFQRNKAIEESFQNLSYKIGINNNKLHFIVSLLPLLMIIDVLLIWKRKKAKNNKATEYLSLSRRMQILFSVSLLAFGVTVFVPWSVYFGNSVQFPFIFQDFVNWNLRILTISIIGTSIVLLLIPPIISDYLVAAISGLGLCVYLQAMFMNQNLGTMNGTEPEWSNHRIFGIINMTIWIIVVLAPFIIKKMTPSLYSKIISATTGIVLFLELLATVSMVFSANQNVWSRTDTYFVDGSNEFQFSKKKNVVLFIFDTLGSEFVKQCFKDSPEIKDVVKDFTWYIDARSNYHMTFPGLSHELTGAFLPAPANTFYELFEKMWYSPSATSFYKQMSDAGFDSRLFYDDGTSSKIGLKDYFHNYFSNIEARNITYEIDYNQLHFCLKQMSGFSFAPFFVKKYFFYAFDFAEDVIAKQATNASSEKEWIPVSNTDFLNKMISSGISTDADQPVFSIFYTTGVHRPWYIDEKCNRALFPFDNPIPTTKSCFYLLSEMIRLLKNANIYDNTAFLICSDHGGNDPKYSLPYDMTFMIKPFNENKKELTIDDSKVQSIDILPTLLYMSCGKDADFQDFEGYSSYNIPIDRIRRVHRYTKIAGIPPPDPNLNKVYPGTNGIEEYNFVDMDSFKFGKDSESFVRETPFVLPKRDKQ